MCPALEHAASAVLPEPHFEGSEKRVEVDFRVPEGSDGLRALSREVLDELMGLAHCCIVSSRSNACFDAYVLSESSLFVYPRKWVLKTCGTTRLLDSLPRLLEHAAAHGMAATRCKYTRASFLFPENQVRNGCSSARGRGARTPRPLVDREIQGVWWRAAHGLPGQRDGWDLQRTDPCLSCSVTCCAALPVQGRL